MYIIGIDDLCRSFYHIMKATSHKGEYNLYYPQRVTLKEILIALRRLLKRKIHLHSCSIEVLDITLVFS